MTDKPNLRWKVGILRISFESGTTWGKDADEAAENFMNGNYTAAETWGPLDAVVSAAEMGTPESERMHLDAKHWLTGAVPDDSRSTDSKVSFGA